MGMFFRISGLNIYLQIIVTVISIAVYAVATRKKQQEPWVKIITLFTMGLSGWFSITSGFFGHILYADEVAASIGWPLHSGFQTELAFASIGIGLIGFAGFWNKTFWLPFIIAKTTFLWGAAGTHILHQIELNNLAPSNTGIVLYWDILFPLILIGLFVLYRREKRNLQTVTS